MSDDKALSVHSPIGLLAPVASLEELQAAYKAKNDFIKSVMKEGTDYGTIPGTGTRPTLLLPGAEKLTTLYGLQVEMAPVESILDWSGDDHGGEPFFYFHYRALGKKGDVVMSTAEGSCNSWEKKYRFRKADRVCPECGAATIFRSKFPDDITNVKGWFCWSAKGGCGAEFDAEHPGIIDQSMEPIKNPNPFDLVNTIQKMGQKRARVAMAKDVSGTSEYFSQDLEDLPYVDAKFTDVPVSEDNPTKVPPKRKTKKKAPAKEKATGRATKASVDTTSIYDAVVNEGLAENTFAAENALAKCSTGWATPVAAVSWMKFYRGHRDLGKSSDAAADLSNAGQPPVG